VRDATDQVLVIDLSPRVDWAKEWRRLTAWLPDDAVGPFTLESIYLTEYHVDRTQVGAIYLDDVGAEALPGKGQTPPGVGPPAAKTG
jgi:hypothetical protein